KILTLDTETRGLFGEVFRVGLYDGSRYRATNTFKNLKTVLSQYTTKYDCHVFIHNLDFDISKIAKDILPEADLKNSIFINNVVTVFKTGLNESQITEENEIISQPITFHDSSKLVMGSLKKICEDFNISQEKAKIDLKDHILKLGWALDADGNPTNDPGKYDDRESQGNYFMKVDPYEPELNEYLRLDCVALYEIVTMLIEISGLPIHEFLKCPTTASLAMKVYQMNYPEDYEKAISTNYGYSKWGEFTEDFIRKAYYGGRTEVFQSELNGGFHYDVNSLYPYVMKVNPIPIGKPRHHKGDKARNVFKYWYSYRQGGGFLECDIHIPTTLHIPPLPHRMYKKLCFPVGNLSGIWTFEEIELALEMGCKKKKINKCIYFEKTDYIFKDFVSYFEEIKNTSDGAKKTFAKLMQNALYGKFGMQRVRQTILPVTEIETCEEKGYPYVELFNPVYGQEFIEAAVPSKAPYIQPHIAAYVTSYARILLYRGLIKQLEKGDVAYCDTDSIACEAIFDDDMVDDREYGKWKLEGILEEGLFIQPKTYYEKYADEIKPEEIEKEISSFSRNVFNYPEKSKVKQYRLVKGSETMKFKGIPGAYIKKLNRGVYYDILEKLKSLQARQERGEMITKKEAYYSIYKGELKRRKFATML
ncbi:DNA polymerase, partial [Nonomuraea sp. NPDC059022]|uniref:DNA polymerase n=1 Tax=Nonomuraea sp. NPDC059022 TaxID=3346705 RepID=UPI0036B9A8D7